VRKWLGRLLLALLLSLLVGLAIGTLLRLRLERPVYYIGAAAAPRKGDGVAFPHQLVRRSPLGIAGKATPSPRITRKLTPNSAF
jgi:hypothetical protein